MMVKNKLNSIRFEMTSKKKKLIRRAVKDGGYRSMTHLLHELIDAHLASLK